MKPFIPKQDARGYITPNFLEYNQNISLSAKSLYGVLTDYARDKDYCYPSKRTLAKRLNSSLNGVKSWLAQLVKDGLVKVVKKQGREFFYLFCPDNTQCQNLPARVSNFDTESNVFKTNNIPPTPKVPYPSKNTKPLQTKRKVEDFSNINKNFEEFWKIYPKKDAKESARSLWFKFFKQGKLPTFEVLQKAISFFAQSSSWVRENGRYVPHLVNFIKGLRWKDMPQEEPKTHKIPVQYEIESLLQRNERDKRIQLEKQILQDKIKIIDEAYEKFKSFFRTPTKIDNCIAYGLFSEFYEAGRTPIVHEKQVVEVLLFLRNYKVLI